MRVELPRRRLVLALALLASNVGRAAESAPRQYAVLSLVGDSFSIVTRRDTVGSAMDRNEQQSLALDGSELDDVAVAAVRQAAARVVPALDEPLRVSIRDPRLYAAEDRLLEEDAEMQPLRDSVRTVLRGAGATHLLLVTKRRQDAAFKMAHGSTGSGKITGIGFYVDNQKRTRRVSTGESSVGVLATYASATVSLVDVESMRMLSSRPAMASTLVTPSRSATATRPWDAMTDDEKLRALRTVLRRAVVDATTELLAG